MGAQAVGAAVGVVVSLFAWWLVTRWPLPTLRFSKICMDAASGNHERSRYRIKILNPHWPWRLGRPRVVDVRVVATLRVPDLDDRKPGGWNNYNIPIVNGGYIPVLGQETAVELRLHKLDLAVKERLMDHVKASNRAAGLAASAPPDLDRLLTYEPRSRLRFAVRATHAYTNATTTKIRSYSRSDIEPGKFWGEVESTRATVFKRSKIVAVGPDAKVVSLSGQEQIEEGDEPKQTNR